MTELVTMGKMHKEILQHAYSSRDSRANGPDLPRSTERAMFKTCWLVLVASVLIGVAGCVQQAKPFPAEPDDLAAAEAFVKEAVKRTTRAQKTAKVEATVQRTGSHTYIAKGELTAQNTFGVYMTDPVAAMLYRDSDEFQIGMLAVGGKKVTVDEAVLEKARADVGRAKAGISDAADFAAAPAVEVVDVKQVPGPTDGTLISLTLKNLSDSPVSAVTVEVAFVDHNGELLGKDKFTAKAAAEIPAGETAVITHRPSWQSELSAAMPDTAKGSATLLSAE